jgi:coenzyme F420-reducing hydrogenase alpha subunit
MTHKTLNLNVPTLTRVEGEGAMHVRVRAGVVEDVQLEIYEPPRMFEAFLRGRHYTEPVDITARICGICPVAYQMSAAHAIESISDTTPDGPIRELRRLLYCGEWIESHVLHIGFLHAPDFVGVDSGIEIARLHPELMAEILHLKKTGNLIMEVIGGRPIHPVNVKLGGFYRSPTRAELATLLPDLERAHAGALDMLRWLATFEYPSIPARLADRTEYVSLRHPDEYPFNEGRIVSNQGLDVDAETFGARLHEYQVAHSTALHAVLDDDRHYQTGPLARWMNNADLVPVPVRDVADELGVGRVETNPFRSILVRGLETLFAIEEAQRIIGSYRPPPRPAVDVPVVAGVGHGCTEAPRGLLYHRYEIDDAGTITDAVIVPPTSQNQDAIEADLRDFVATHLDLDDHTLGHRCEQVIRNYDPCISCATHFLRFSIERDR